MKGAATVANEAIQVEVERTQAHMAFSRNLRKSDNDAELGEFFFLIDITALSGTVYIPISIASGKKPSGFVYQIEGTAPGSIVTAEVSCKGDGVTQVTLGTILYAKISKGMAATFRALIHVRGRTKKEYRVVINRINYKRDMATLRYEQLAVELATELQKLK